MDSKPRTEFRVRRTSAGGHRRAACPVWFGAPRGKDKTTGAVGSACGLRARGTPGSGWSLLWFLGCLVLGQRGNLTGSGLGFPRTPLELKNREPFSLEGPLLPSLTNTSGICGQPGVPQEAWSRVRSCEKKGSRYLDCYLKGSPRVNPAALVMSGIRPCVPGQKHMTVLAVRGMK